MTDALEYTSGDEGTATFENLWRDYTIWLGRCTTFVQEELVEGEWVDRGGEFDCFWEGFARPIAPKEKLVEPFIARESGRWRLAYDVGFGCSANAPLTPTDCVAVRRVPSLPFDVDDPIDDEGLCFETGGTWDPTSCGHWQCDHPPICAAIIPGCSCGPSALFVDGIGCLPAPCGVPQ